jgi:integrase
MGKLNHRSIATLPPGRHGDGNGLCLNVGNGGRSWVYRYRRGGKRHEIGLGSTATVSLSAARDLALDFHIMLKKGEDPRTARKPTSTHTFDDCVMEYIKAHKVEWTNEKHAGEWGYFPDDEKKKHRKSCFERLCPSLLLMPVDTIDTEALLAVLSPIWRKKRETANRLRGRIELVLSYAKSRGYRSGENPARWRDHMEHLLGGESKIKKHLPALPYDDLPALMIRIQAMATVASRALEFSILTAARANEVVSAQWPQIDLKAEVWTIQAEAMKARTEHRVPLVGRALEIVKQMAEIRTSEWVFPGRKPGKPFGHNALNECLQRRLGVTGATQHGFRSTFRDWVGDKTSFGRDLAEAALAHKVGSDVERSYRRGNALERRRELMRAWDSFCASRGNVTSIASRRVLKTASK